jgi:hypothetical protein
VGEAQHVAPEAAEAGEQIGCRGSGAVAVGAGVSDLARGDDRVVAMSVDVEEAFVEAVGADGAGVADGVVDLAQQPRQVVCPGLGRVSVDDRGEFTQVVGVMPTSA